MARAYLGYSAAMVTTGKLTNMSITGSDNIDDRHGTHDGAESSENGHKAAITTILGGKITSKSVRRHELFDRRTGIIRSLLLSSGRTSRRSYG